MKYDLTAMMFQIQYNFDIIVLKWADLLYYCGILICLPYVMIVPRKNV